MPLSCVGKETIRWSYDALFNVKQFVLKTFDRSLFLVKPDFTTKKDRITSKFKFFQI